MVPIDGHHHRLLLLPRLLPLLPAQVLPLLLVSLGPLQQCVDASIGDGLVIVVQSLPPQQAEVRPSTNIKRLVQLQAPNICMDI